MSSPLSVGPTQVTQKPQFGEGDTVVAPHKPPSTLPTLSPDAPQSLVQDTQPKGGSTATKLGEALSGLKEDNKAYYGSTESGFKGTMKKLGLGLSAALTFTAMAVGSLAIAPIALPILAGTYLAKGGERNASEFLKATKGLYLATALTLTFPLSLIGAGLSRALKDGEGKQGDVLTLFHAQDAGDVFKQIATDVRAAMPSRPSTTLEEHGIVQVIRGGEKATDLPTIKQQQATRNAESRAFKGAMSLILNSFSGQDYSQKEAQQSIRQELGNLRSKVNDPSFEKDFQKFFSKNSLLKMVEAGLITSNEADNLHLIHEILNEPANSPNRQHIPTLMNEIVIDKRVYSDYAVQMEVGSKLMGLKTRNVSNETDRTFLRGEIHQLLTDYDPAKLVDAKIISQQDLETLKDILNQLDKNPEVQDPESSKRRAITINIGAPPKSTKASATDKTAQTSEPMSLAKISEVCLHCIAELGEHHLQQVGLWRHAGNSTITDSLKNQGDKLTKEEINAKAKDPNVLVDLTKRLLRSFPDNFIEKNQIPARVTGEDAQIAQLQKLYEDIGPEKAKILDALLRHWVQVSNLSEINKMPASNIGIAASPSLMEAGHSAGLVEDWIGVVGKLPPRV